MRKESYVIGNDKVDAAKAPLYHPCNMMLPPAVSFSLKNVGGWGWGGGIPFGLMFEISKYETNLKNNRFFEMQIIKEFASEHSRFFGVMNLLSLLPV